MKLLMIAAGYLPYLFSENLCNAKLVYALKESGIEVDVISKIDEGPTYGREWTAPWDVLKPNTYLIEYVTVNRLTRLFDVIYSGISMGMGIEPGIRWIRRAYDKAIELMEHNHYDAVLTRSPNDLPHLVGYKLRKKKGIKWIANWNDPAAPIWPEPYTHHYSSLVQRKKYQYTLRMLSSADVTTFPSDSLRQHFINHFPILKERRTEVIPHIALSESIFKRIERKHNKKLMFCHSGNLSKERDPELIFNAFREIIDKGFTDFEFHIMGFVNEFTQYKIKKFNLEEFVKCPGSFPYFEALERMQNYDVLVLLEAQVDQGIFFASKFTDYAQIGLPILAISPAKGFAQDMIGKYGGGLTADNKDCHDIKDKILSTINLWKKNELQNLNPKGLYENFSAQSVVDLYTSII